MRTRAIGFGFASDWVKTPVTKGSNRNRVMTFDCHFKVALKKHEFCLQDLVQKWRERGNHLFKYKQYELVVKYYSLAICYVPQTGSENSMLRAMLLSNRCAAYINLEMYDKALDDARKCVESEPEWSKVRCIDLLLPV